MPKQQLNKDKSDGISHDVLFAIMGRLSVRQRAVLSLKYFEDMNLGQVSYVLEMGYFHVMWYILNTHIRLKLLLMFNGYYAIPLKRFIAVFGKLTNVQPFSNSFHRENLRYPASRICDSNQRRKICLKTAK